MPIGAVKGKRQEKYWERAKNIVRKQYGQERWPLIMRIFQNIKKKHAPKKRRLTQREAILRREVRPKESMHMGGNLMEAKKFKLVRKLPTSKSEIRQMLHTQPVKFPEDQQIEQHMAQKREQKAMEQSNAAMQTQQAVDSAHNPPAPQKGKKKVKESLVVF